MSKEKEEIIVQYDYPKTSNVDKSGTIALGPINGLNPESDLVLNLEDDKFTLLYEGEFVASFTDWLQLVRFLHREYCQLNEVEVTGVIANLNSY